MIFIGFENKIRGKSDHLNGLPHRWRNFRPDRFLKPVRYQLFTICEILDCQPADILEYDYPLLLPKIYFSHRLKILTDFNSKTIK